MTELNEEMIGKLSELYSQLVGILAVSEVNGWVYNKELNLIRIDLLDLIQTARGQTSPKKKRFINGNKRRTVVYNGKEYDVRGFCKLLGISQATYYRLSANQFSDEEIAQRYEDKEKRE